MGWIQETSSAVLSRFAQQRRRVVGIWRIWIECRRLAVEASSPLPGEADLQKVLKSLIALGNFTPIPGTTSDVFRIDLPFAEIIPVTEEQIVQEADPTAVFSHLTALVHHALTDQLPNRIHVTSYATTDQTRVPLGTTPEDWVDLPPPRVHRLKAVNGVEVRWFKTKGGWDFGTSVGYSQASPIYVTDVERTLLDILRSPAEVGGPVIVFRAWCSARSTMRVERVVEYAERFGQPVLRQRIGYLLTALGLTHPQLRVWQRSLQRGGSLKLIASEPYSSTYSPEWNISLNVPPEILNELRE
jgi:predicted transcriptional regulator of viral defense system